MPEGAHKKFIRDAASLYLGRGVNMAIGLLSTFFYGVIFSKSGIAQISLFEMLVSLVLSLGFSWTTTGLVRFGKSEQLSSGSLYKTSSVRLVIVFPMLFAAILAAFLWEEQISAYVGLSGDYVVWLLIATILLSVAHEHINYLQTTIETHSKNVIYFLALSVSKCSILLLLYLGFFSATPVTYLSLTITGQFLLLVGRISFVGRQYYLPLVWPDLEEVKKYLNFCLPQIFGFAGIFLINWIDLYFLRKHYPLEDIGAYQFLYSIFVKLASFSVILNTLFFPKIMEWKENNSSSLNKYVMLAPITVMAVVTFGIALFFPAYLFLFPHLFGDKFSALYPSFNVLLTSLPFYFASFMLIPLLNGFDRVRDIQIINLLCAGVNLGLDYFLIENYGPIAAANATFVAYLVQFILLKRIVDSLFATKRSFSFSYIVLILILLICSIANTFSWSVGMGA